MKYAPLPTFTAEQVVEAIAGNDDVVAAQAFFSIASSGMPPTQAERLLLEGAKDSRLGRRRAAVIGAGYFARAQRAASPALVAMLEAVRETDPDRETRGAAEDAISDIEMLG